MLAYRFNEDNPPRAGHFPLPPFAPRPEPMSLGGLDRIYHMPGSLKLSIHFINSSI